MFVKGIKLFFIVVIFMFFIGISDVSAKNDNGYATCHYAIDDEYIRDKYDSFTMQRLWIVLSVKQRNTFTANCYMGGTSEGMSGVCAIATVDRKVDMVENMHRKGSSVYRCPSEIYVYSEYETEGIGFWEHKWFTREGLQKLTISHIAETKENLFMTKATLKMHFELSDADGSEHSLDEADNSYTILYDASDFHKAEPFGGNYKSANIDAIMCWGRDGKWVNNQCVDGDTEENILNVENIDCAALLSNFEDEQTVRDFLNNLFWIISIIGIVLLIIMTAFEFIKVVTGQDDEGLIKAFKHTVIRAICVVILLLLPVILSAILGFMNDITDNEYYYLKDENGEIIYRTNDEGQEEPIKLVHIGATGDPLCGIAELEDNQ